MYEFFILGINHLSCICFASAFSNLTSCVYFSQKHFCLEQSHIFFCLFDFSLACGVNLKKNTSLRLMPRSLPPAFLFVFSFYLNMWFTKLFTKQLFCHSMFQHQFYNQCNLFSTIVQFPTYLLKPALLVDTKSFILYCLLKFYIDCFLVFLKNISNV